MNQFLKFSLIFLISYVFILTFFPPEKNTPQNQIILKWNQEFSIWKLVSFDISNFTKDKVSFKDYCPNSPVKIEFSDFWEKKEISKNIKTENCKKISLNAWETKKISFWEENYQLFHKIWKYKIILEEDSINWEKIKDWEKAKIFEENFQITPEWFFMKIWDSVFYKPLYNFLIALIQYWPYHSLAFAIIILTLVIKILLLLPNHKALKNQKALQKIQPHLDEVKKKHAWDQAKIAQETMAVWKKHWVNPAWSCLPVLIQFPFLIALFYIIKDGLTANNIHLLYPSLQNFDFKIINSEFFWLFNLADTKVIVLALLVWATQYWQMHLTFKNQAKPQASSWNDFMAQQMQMMSKTMKYVMPVMIWWFTFVMPAWLWIYWFISTLFAAWQQFYVNFKHDNNWWNWDNKKSWKNNKNISDAVIVKKRSEKNSEKNSEKKSWWNKNKDWITIIEA